VAAGKTRKRRESAHLLPAPARIGKVWERAWWANFGMAFLVSRGRATARSGISR
jgi:hypothetical protein